MTANEQHSKDLRDLDREVYALVNSYTNGNRTEVYDACEDNVHLALRVLRSTQRHGMEFAFLRGMDYRYGRKAS